MNLKNLKIECEKLNITLPITNSTDVLGEAVSLGSKTVHNRLAVQPMEGCDGESDGSVSDLVRRRYLRFAEGGAGLIWAEATAVVNEGRANPRQLMLSGKTADSFKSLIEIIKENCLKQNGYEPVIICQLTHSGRQSNPTGKPAPIIAYRNALFEKTRPVDDGMIATDDYLATLPDKFAKAATLAAECGFDGADVKCCHGYLFAELLSAYGRKGNYGGSFENRTRLYTDSLRAVKSAVSSDFIVTSRLNAYDGFEYPFGFGVREGEGGAPCLDETKALVDIMHNTLGIGLINVTIGNPYVNPHLNRPFNKGGYSTPEHPLCSVLKMINCTVEIKAAFPDLKIVGSSYSYLGEAAPYLAAGEVQKGVCDIAGFGRMAIAYPDFVRDIIAGNFDKNKCCLACSKCSEMMRAGGVAGCVIRDSEVYLPLYKEYVLK